MAGAEEGLGLRHQSFVLALECRTQLQAGRTIAGEDEVMGRTFRRTERNNPSVTFGGKLILKTFRRMEPGVNPDLEIGRFLTERQVDWAPPIAGYVEYRPRGGEAPHSLMGQMPYFAGQPRHAADRSSQHSWQLHARINGRWSQGKRAGAD